MLKENNTLSADTFEWRMQDGSLIKPKAMRTTHLFYSVRMVFNALVPPDYRIPGKIYTLSTHMPPGYWRAAVEIMLKELAKRRDLSPVFKAELIKMAQITEKLATLQITTKTANHS